MHRFRANGYQCRLGPLKTRDRLGSVHLTALTSIGLQYVDMLLVRAWNSDRLYYFWQRQDTHLQATRKCSLRGLSMILPRNGRAAFERSGESSTALKRHLAVHFFNNGQRSPRMSATLNSASAS